MEWPDIIIDGLTDSLKFKLSGGIQKYEVIEAILDLTGRDACALFNNDPKLVAERIDEPPTVIGGVVPGGILSLDGVDAVRFADVEKWKSAVNEIHEFVRRNPQMICEEYAYDPMDDALYYDEDASQSVESGGFEVVWRDESEDDEDEWV